MLFASISTCSSDLLFQLNKFFFLHLPECRSYLENPEADAKNYFFLTMSGDNEDNTPDKSRYFLTGDVGVLDSEGFLSLKGRAKELIKKGGEQVSPYEGTFYCFRLATSLMISATSFSCALYFSSF